jgi:glycosyltransferase involved in cell wall biosynthesis
MIPPSENIVPPAQSAPARSLVHRRILYLQPAPTIGGAERQATLILPRLAGYGLDPLPVTGPGRDVLGWFRAHGFENALWSAHFPSGEPLDVSRLPAFFASARALTAELDALHRAAPFDAIVGSLGYGWLLAGLCARRWNVPAIWRAGGLSFGRTARARSPEGLGLRLLGRLARPAALLCNAEAVARYWRPLVDAPCHVVPNGVPLPALEPVRRVRGPLALGFAGRLAPEKNLPLLVRAIALLRRREVPVRLLVAGPGPREALAAEVRRYGLEDRIELLGRVDHMEEFYRHCDAFVLPSRSEGCANVVLEAMAHGLPVVATRVGGTPELVTDGVQGFLVPTDDAEALARAVDRLATAPGLRARMGSSARRRAQAFSPERAAGTIARLVHEVIAAHAPGNRHGPAVASAVPSQAAPSHSRRRSSTKRFST